MLFWAMTIYGDANFLSLVAWKWMHRKRNMRHAPFAVLRMLTRFLYLYAQYYARSCGIIQCALLRSHAIHFESTND